MELIISLISGAVGGNLAGGLMKNFSLGTLWNSVAGIAGGGIGGSLLAMLGLGAGAVGGGDIGSIVSTVAGGGVGGAVVLAVVGAIKNAMGKG